MWFWSVASHTLSLYAPSPAFMSAFHSMYAFLVKGPPGWLPYHVAVHLPRMNWKLAPPHAKALATKLQLRQLLRLSHCDIPALCGEIREAHLVDTACLLPLTRPWLKSSSLICLEEVERLAVLGNLVKRTRGTLQAHSLIRHLSCKQSSSKARRIIEDWLRSGPLSDGGRVLRAWLSGRTRRNPDWSSYAGLSLLERLLSSIFRDSPPRHANAVLRLATKEIVLTTIDDVTRCVLASGCGGGNEHSHYFGSTCYVTPRLARLFPGYFPIAQAFRRRITREHVRVLGQVAYVLVKAINLSRNSSQRPPFAVDHVLLHERWR